MQDGTFEEIAASERAAWVRASWHDAPTIILAQPSLFDPTRAPAGKGHHGVTPQQTAWAYCHVPHGSTIDMTDKMEAQIERFAPGFRSLVLKRHTMFPKDVERHNVNYIGGDITGGVMDLQQFIGRWKF